MSRHDIAAVPWAVMAPLIPQPTPGPGRKRHDARQPLHGLLFGLKTGWTWPEVPRRYGSLATCWRRFGAWAKDGPWARRWRVLLSQREAQGQRAWTRAFLDGRFVPAQTGALGLAQRNAAKAAR